MLLGRDTERRRIETLLADARAGTSGVLILRGEPGIGKTALLDHAAALAGDARVLRARGLESEIEVPFGGLDELLRPVLGELDDVPDALAAALGGREAEIAERHLVGAAVLTVLGGLSEDQPLVVLVDDAQWLDGPSGAALTFAARRLLADAVAFIAATRTGEACALDNAGFAELAIAGLGADDARALLAGRAGRPIAQDTATWLHAATDGNPLALVELADEAPRLRPGPVEDHVAVGERTARALGRRLDRISQQAHAALLVAAVADTEAIEPVLAAGASLAGLEEAESAELVRLRAGRVAFRHPLVRSVVLARAGAPAGRAAHRAFAAALDPEHDADRRAWHTAAGTVTPDEEVASALAEVGLHAAARGGHATAAAALEHAARLTPDRALAGERLCRAADATWLAGDGPGALALLDEASALPLDTAARAAAEHLRGRVLARRGPLPLAVRVLSYAAEAIASDDPGLASEMLAEAAYAAGYELAGEVMDRTSRRAVALAPADDPRARCIAAIARGAVLVLRGDPEAADHLDEAFELIDSTPALRDDVRVGALLGVPTTFSRASGEKYAPLHRAVALARERGAVGVLPFALFYVGAEALGSPRWAEAAAAFGEGVRLAREADLPVDEISCLAGLARVEARRDVAEAATAHATEALERSRAAEMVFFEAWALHALADVAWASGDVEAAIDAYEDKARVLAERAIGDPDLSPSPELVEALMHLGRVGEASALAADAAAAAERKGRPWALARARRAQALADPDDAAACARYDAALALHELEADVFERARTQLCLGERLRRAGRRADAREPLRGALDAFEDLGARPWAERAAAELAATGETVRRRDPSTLDDLTAQELRIAMMLAEGASTREAATALYLSPKTIEYHLRHVYQKLGVNSRAALAQALRPDQSSAASSSAARAAPPSPTGR
jgi:DNA-binding CsgD family transcriptional regulator